MSFFKNLLDSVVTGRNYFARDDLGQFPSERVSTLIVLDRDCKGRPDMIVQASNYREVPNFGTWEGMQVHTKVAPHIWHVHYEDFHLEGL